MVRRGGGGGAASHGGVTKKRGHTQTISEAICSQETFFKLGEGNSRVTRTLRQRGQERRRAGCMQIVFSFFLFAQVEENVKETLGDDDDDDDAPSAL